MTKEMNILEICEEERRIQGEIGRLHMRLMQLQSMKNHNSQQWQSTMTNYHEWKKNQPWKPEPIARL